MFSLNIEYIIPPIAAVRVAPIVVDNAVAAPKLANPPVRLPSIKKYPIAAALRASKDAFIACRPGRRRGDELNRPCSFP